MSADPKTSVIGVLALQGDYASHADAVREAGGEPRLVRRKEELDTIGGLILPGGESTTFLKLLDRTGLFEPLLQFTRTRPSFGTCAGCILLAREVRGPEQASLGVLDATVERNAYGRQVDSEILMEPTSLPGGPMEMVYIRAPRIARVGPSVEVLASRDGFPVFVRQGHLLAATFHPELSQDRRVHAYFMRMLEETQAANPDKMPTRS